MDPPGGAPQAFVARVEPFRAPVRRMLKSLLPSPEDAEDVFHATLPCALVALPGLRRPAAGTMAGWPRGTPRPRGRRVRPANRRGMRWRAVVLDPFGTLVPNLSLPEHRAVLGDMARALGVPPEHFIEGWMSTGRLCMSGELASPEANAAFVCRNQAWTPSPEALAAAGRIRRAYSARPLVPKPDAADTLRRIRASARRIGRAHHGLFVRGAGTVAGLSAGSADRCCGVLLRRARLQAGSAALPHGPRTRLGVLAEECTANRHTSRNTLRFGRPRSQSRGAHLRASHSTCPVPHFAGTVDGHRVALVEHEVGDLEHRRQTCVETGPRRGLEGDAGRGGGALGPDRRCAG